MPAGLFQDRDASALQGGGQDSLGLAEPTPAVIQGPQPDQVGVQPGRVGVADKPDGGRSQVLDLGVEVALTACGRLGRIGQQRRIVLA